MFTAVPSGKKVEVERQPPQKGCFVNRDRFLGGIVGICVGDAVGLPVEYRSRSYLKEDPVTEMIGYGTHNQPPGTWSSESSLALCTVESLLNGFSLADMAARFVRFAKSGHWTPSDNPSDLSPVVREAIARIAKSAGRLSPRVNIDGDHRAEALLVRVLPMTVAVADLSVDDRFKRVAQVASLTNAHMRAVLGCHIVSETALELLADHTPEKAYSNMGRQVAARFAAEASLSAFERVLKRDLSRLGEGDVATEGGIVHAVEAALWCLLTEKDFPSVVLKAANLGGITTTTAALAGGLAGYAYGLEQIPEEWISTLARGEEIAELAGRLFQQTAIQR